MFVFRNYSLKLTVEALEKKKKIKNSKHINAVVSLAVENSWDWGLFLLPVYPLLCHGGRPNKRYFFFTVSGILVSFLFLFS